MSAHPQDELFTAYVDGTLSAADRDALEAHLAACGQCRSEVGAARAGAHALADLPRELDPSIDVAAAVLSRAGRPEERHERDRAPATTPRWYRAAGLVAAAAVLALAIFAIPRLGGDDDRAATEAAGGAGNAGPGRVTAVTQDPREFDDVSLAALAAHQAAAAVGRPGASVSAQDGLAAPAASAAAGFETAQRVDELAGCVRRGAGGHVEAGAQLIGLILARFEGSSAVLGSFLQGPAEHPTSLIVVAVARTDCRFLGSAAHGI